MPIVTVVFNPQKVPQDLVDKLKQRLPFKVAQILSSEEVRIDPSSAEDIEVGADDIKVTQQATNPTDVNMSALMIRIEAGRPKGRSGDMIVKLLGEYIAETHLISPLLLYHDQCCIFLTFHEYNGFQFIPRPVR